MEKALSRIKKNILLKNYTTFKIGGSVKYFFEVESKEDLILAIKLAKKLKLPFFILGGGSNLLVADERYNGLVIKMKNTKCKMRNEKLKCKIFVEAGYSLAKLVRDSIYKNLTGLEWAAGIPGTIGGAIKGNAGAFGSSMADIVKTVEVLDSKNLKTKIFKNKDCKFGYRDSIFKKNKTLIILSTKLQLERGNKKEIEKKIKEYLNYRKKTQPLDLPSAGSIFKNPPGKSAGELIEKCGLKGKKIGNAQISEKHANFIVNLGGAKAKDVLKLINLAKKKVKERFSIELEEELTMLFKNEIKK